MEKKERIEFISAILTAGHIINTQKSEENFSEIVGLYFKYYEALKKNLPGE
jgi:hypothetical protein